MVEQFRIRDRIFPVTVCRFEKHLNMNDHKQSNLLDYSLMAVINSVM